jgi:hypothetical protein
LLERLTSKLALLGMSWPFAYAKKKIENTQRHRKCFIYNNLKRKSLAVKFQKLIFLKETKEKKKLNYL